jgi:thioredoxin reductase
MTRVCENRSGPIFGRFGERQVAARPAPYLLETSRPRIFAVGDVRGGNIKRVASAVVEGSIAVAFVRQVLRQ